MNTNIISGPINRLAAIFSLLFVNIRVHSWLKFFPGKANGHKPQNPLVPGELSSATLRLCALARMSLLIQAVVLAKAQRRKGRKGTIPAMVGLNSQRPSKPGNGHIVISVAAATVETDRQAQPSLPRLRTDALTVPALKSRLSSRGRCR